MKLGVWIGLNVVLCVIVLPGSIVSFDHFWQKWEFLASAAAALYFLFFAIGGFVYPTQAGGRPLYKTLQAPSSVFVYLIFHFALPSGLLGIAAGVILYDRHHGHGAVDPNRVFLKLVLTFVAFLSVWLGDFLTARHLRKRIRSTEADLQQWARHLQRHAYLIDLPLMIGYFGLSVIFIGHHSTQEDKLLLQAFVGGASALEMLVLGAVHGFAEFADREERSNSPFQFRSSAAGVTRS